MNLCFTFCDKISQKVTVVLQKIKRAPWNTNGGKNSPIYRTEVGNDIDSSFPGYATVEPGLRVPDPVELLRFAAGGRTAA